VGCARNGEVSGSKCKEKERMCRNGECKERGGQCKKKGKCDNKGEQKPYIQFLCTAHLYSTKHTVVLIRTCLLHSTQPH
jgi:hypothetical protein